MTKRQRHNKGLGVKGRGCGGQGRSEGMRGQWWGDTGSKDGPSVVLPILTRHPALLEFKSPYFFLR